MPVSADRSPNILWPLPDGVPAFSKDNIFDKKMLSQIKYLLEKNANWGPGSENNPGANHYHTITGRWPTEIDLPKEIWDYVYNLGKNSWAKDDLRLKNIWFARYQQYNGITPYLWEHMDHPGTQYTMDTCIESPGVSWSVIVDGETFPDKENSALFFMAQQQAHSRPPYPVNDENAYVVMMFASFVDSSHWLYEIDMYDPDQNKALSELVEKYRIDGDVRYYEYSGHAPRLDGLPPGNPSCMGGECTQCGTSVDPEFTKKIKGYKDIE